MSNVTHSSVKRPKPFAVNWSARLGWCLLAVYLVYACSQLGFSAERFSAGIEHGQRFVARMFPPNFGRWQLICRSP
jgi:phosphonate transport system permease protein